MNPTIIMLVVLGGMMFFMTRTQKKQQQKRQELLNSMTVGSKVVTIGGLHGVVAEIDSGKDTVWLDCEGIQLEFNRTAISTVTPTVGDVPVAEQTIVEDTVVEVSEGTVKEAEKTEES